MANEILDALNPLVDGIKSEIKSADAKLAADIAQLNEDAQKKNETIGELATKVKEMSASANRLKSGIESSAKKDWTNSDKFKSAIYEIVAENFDKIKSETPFQSTKDVADMTLSNNLTGTSQISYVPSNLLRSFYNPHLYDVFRIIPTATGNVTFPRGNSPVGEGSFGAQTEGNSKSQVDYDVTMVNVAVPFIAGFTKVSRQMLQDLPFLQAYLSQSLVEDWNRAVNTRFLNTIASGSTALSTSATVNAEKMIDGIAQHMDLGLGMPNVILTTHASWATLMKTKPSDYSVPGGVTIGANGETRIVGIPVVPHSQVTGSRFYVINTDAFGIAQASALSVRSTEFDDKDFQKNLITYRAEARIELLSFQPKAAVYGTTGTA
jgi:HK97 family phage major capsid protein